MQQLAGFAHTPGTVAQVIFFFFFRALNSKDVSLTVLAAMEPIQGARICAKKRWEAP